MCILGLAAWLLLIFKFHFDSINIDYRTPRKPTLPGFKFHFDSINMDDLRGMALTASDL